jgi:hypothetical protein
MKGVEALLVLGVMVMSPAAMSQSLFTGTWRPDPQVFSPKDGKIVKISLWSVRPDGKTMHVRFDDTHGHVQEQDGHKVE